MDPHLTDVVLSLAGLHKVSLVQHHYPVVARYLSNHKTLKPGACR